MRLRELCAQDTLEFPDSPRDDGVHQRCRVLVRRTRAGPHEWSGELSGVVKQPAPRAGPVARCGPTLTGPHRASRKPLQRVLIEASALRTTPRSLALSPWEHSISIANAKEDLYRLA